MQDALRNLEAALLRPGPPPAVPEDVVDAAARDAVVVLPAGGFGYRMRGVSEGPGAVTQKALLPLPNGETLIGRLVRQYRDAGCRRFVALLNHDGEAVEAHLAGGVPWDVEVRVSYDPDSTGSGRTGAMVHAMDRGVLTGNGTVVVHNADCHLMRYAGSFPRDLLRAHAAAVAASGAAATVAAVAGTQYPYTGMRLEGGQVTGVEMYPYLPVPAHTGITVVSPEGLRELRENAAGSKQNFERDMFPRWCAAGRLAGMLVPAGQWIAVDDRKAYRIFSQAVAGETE